MNINKLLTTVNYKKATNKQNKYIVIHYVGAEGSAENNCKYFQRFYRGASAHYFVGHNGEIWQCVEDFNTAWHCGALKYKHKYCRNTNSIGVEMCCRKGSSGWYFEPSTITSTVGLVKELMAKYNIPVENVLRHYDITGKICPQPYVANSAAWDSFKAALVDKAPVVEKPQKTVEELAREVIKGLWGNGAERKKRLTAAGYNYTEIQRLVNKLMK